MRARTRPLGQHTRGKTASNRLRQIDVWLALAMPQVLRGGEPIAVDVGFGAHPWTTLEMAQRWRRINPALRVLGVEIDPARVEAARPFSAGEATRFELGGFNVPAVLGAEKARVVRCYNVLRQYDESEVRQAHALMADALEPGGVLIEGTSNPTGAMVAFDVWRRAHDGERAPARLEHVALVFGTNFRQPLGPADFQTILPKRLIHRARTPEASRFFGDWQRACEITRHHGSRSHRAHWNASAAELKERFGHPIDTRPRLVERGYLGLSATLGE